MTKIKHKYEKGLKYNLPDRHGFYGDFGGAYVPDNLKLALKQLEVDFERAWADDEFLNEVYETLKEASGRPTPLYFAKNLTEHYGRAKIYLKREDLNHTGSHKLNNVMGQALLAKKLGNTKVIAETGAGQHGVAVATCCAVLGMECKVFMGENDIARQKLNVERMKMLGAEVIPVTKGLKTLKDAVDAAIEYWLNHADDTFYILGSTVGPHPYPKIVRCFQSVIGVEAKEQLLKREGKLPNYVLACVGGGSNSSGIFYTFYDDTDKVKLIGLEAGGEGIETGKHSAAMTCGKKTVLQGGMQYALVDENGDVAKSFSISAGIDYPGCGPELCYLKDKGMAEFHAITDKEAIQAFGMLSKLEGIVPAIESAHAIAYLEKLMPTTKEDEIVLVNISGRGDKDGERLVQYFE